MHIFKQMRREEIPPNTVTFASAIAACAHAGATDEAFELMELSFATDTPRNTIVYSAAISACDKAGKWERALELLKRMQDDGVEADSALLNAIASSCARAGQVDATESVVREEFQARNLEPDRITFNALLSAHSRSEPPNVEAIREVMAEMAELGEGFAPDTVSFNTLIHALGRAERSDEALAVLRKEMPDKRVRVDAISYTSAIAACNATGDYEGAVATLRDAEADSGARLGTLAYSKAIGALSGAARWREACELLNAIGEKDLPHNPVTLNTVLESCAAEATEAGAAATAGLEALRLALSTSEKAAAIALGPRPTKPLRGEPRADRASTPTRMAMCATHPPSSTLPALPPIPSAGPPTDRRTVELTRKLLELANDGAFSSAESEKLVLSVEKATLKLKRTRGRRAKDWNRPFKSRAQAQKQRGRGGRGRGRGMPVSAEP
jgi:pentatricopeptide repeat protein